MLKRAWIPKFRSRKEEFRIKGMTEGWEQSDWAYTVEVV